MALYVKLPSGLWIRVKARVRKPENVGPGVRVFGLIGESLDGEPSVNGDPAGSFYVSAFRVTKYIIAVLDEGIEGDIVVKPVTRETYKVEIYGAPRRYVERLKEIAEELKALKTLKKKIGSSRSSSSS